MCVSVCDLQDRSHENGDLDNYDNIIFVKLCE